MSRFLCFCLVVVARGFSQADDCLTDESSHDFVSLIQTKVETSRRALDDAANTSSMQLVVRYAMLSPSGNTTYLDKVGLPQLGSSICLAEQNLATEMVTRFGSPNSYLIYTDHGTHKHVDHFLAATFDPQTTSRVKLVNLDEDPEDDARMLPFKNIGLDDVNFASVRRTLADTKHQLPGSGRLLLGTDISFLAPPVEFLKEMNLIGAEDAKVRYLDGGLTLAHYDGPQCLGLNADFVYMAPGVKQNLTSLVEKMLWYASLPKIHGRFTPNSMANQNWEMKNNWLHGLDQWALMMSLAEVVKPQGPQGCQTLSVDRYCNYGSCVLAGGNERAGIHRQGVEVAHDKILSKCLAGASPF